ncbi:FMN-dependent NADH-azoreductase 3 [Lysinibacillus sp. PLM2]|nr:FMN-dependent NADH-azoreductase 3 [Lysinibacillus sp. PLM2]
MTKNVLVIKANNRPDGVSTKMYETFVAEANQIEGVQVTTFDVFEENMPYFGQTLFNAFGKLQNNEELNEAEAATVAARQKSMDAIKAADVVVWAFPLWNLTIPAALQTFIDYTYASGFSFKYNEEGQLVSLLTDKKTIILSARGGYYSTPESAPLEMAHTYIKNVACGVYGMELLEEVVIEGHNAEPQRAEQIIAEGLEKVKQSAQLLKAVTA